MTYVPTRLARLTAALAAALLPVVASAPAHADEPVGEFTITVSPGSEPRVAVTPGTVDPATHVAAVQGTVEGLSLDLEDCRADVAPGPVGGVVGGVTVSDCAGQDARIAVATVPTGTTLSGLAVFGSTHSQPGAPTYSVECDVFYIFPAILGIKCKVIVTSAA